MNKKEIETELTTNSKKEWPYAIHSKIVSEYGGPEQYVESLEKENYQKGYEEGKQEGYEEGKIDILEKLKNIMYSIIALSLLVKYFWNPIKQIILNLFQKIKEIGNKVISLFQ